MGDETGRIDKAFIALAVSAVKRVRDADLNELEVEQVLGHLIANVPDKVIAAVDSITARRGVQDLEGRRG